MKYEVLERFQDTDGHIYEATKPYPVKGNPKKERVEALTTSNNRYGRPFIKEVKGSDQEEPPAENVGAETIDGPQEVKESKKLKEGK